MLCRMLTLDHSGTQSHFPECPHPPDLGPIFWVVVIMITIMIMVIMIMFTMIMVIMIMAIMIIVIMIMAIVIMVIIIISDMPTIDPTNIHLDWKYGL